MGRYVRHVFLGLCFFSTALAAVLGMDGARRSAEAAGEVFVIEFEGPVSPGTAMFVTRGLEKAEDRGAGVCVIRLDTPGGLASSMRAMVKGILNSRVPVVVYVAPQGAGAASAGVMVTVAGHVAAMAPGTNIGAAHPVGAGGKDIGKTMSKKVVNDMASYGRGIAEEKGRNGEWVEKAIRESVSITAREALEKGVIDLVAEDLEALMGALDGREVELSGEKVVLKTAGLQVVFYRPGFRDKVLNTVSDPNIAYILMMIGLAGLYFELAHPGAIFPGVIGGISLILAFFSFQALPVNYAGLLLIALAVIFFVAEVFVTSYGILSIGGLISLIFGSIMLFEDTGVSMELLLPTALLIGAFFAVVAALAFRAYRGKPVAGEEGLVGERGVVQEAIDPEGVVFVHGEYWSAVAEELIDAGESVEVEAVNGLILKVKRSNKDLF